MNREKQTHIEYERRIADVYSELKKTAHHSDIGGEFFPVKLWIELTNICNLDCIMCARVTEENSTLEKGCIKRLEKVIETAEILSWQGGEVFLVPYFKDLILELSSKYPQIQHEIFTNGLLLDHGWIEIIAELDIKLMISLDSIEKDLYQTIRKNGSLDKVLDNIKALVKAFSIRGGTADLALNYIVMKDNINELPKLAEFCKSYQIANLTLLRLVPDRFPEGEIFVPDNREILDLLTENIDLLEANAAEMNINVESSVIKEALDPPKKRVSTNILCLKPWTNMYITCFGEIKPSCECDVSLGNIYSDKPTELWRKGLIDIYREEIYKGDYSKFCSYLCSKMGFNSY